MVITPNLERLLHQAPLPCIIQWGQKGFAVIMPGRSSEKIRVTDPAYGIAHYTKKQFSTKWPDTDRDEGDAVLLLAPTPAFYQHRHPKESGTGWSFLSRYFSRYRR
jgi:ATP-binding cassette subfamily B protein